MKPHSPITTDYWIIRATLCNWPSSSWIFMFSASCLSWFWPDFPLTHQRVLTPTRGQYKMVITCEMRSRWNVNYSLQSLRMYTCVCRDISLLIWVLFSVTVHKQLCCLWWWPGLQREDKMDEAATAVKLLFPLWPASWLSDVLNISKTYSKHQSLFCLPQSSGQLRPLKKPLWYNARGMLWNMVCDVKGQILIRIRMESLTERCIRPIEGTIFPVEAVYPRKPRPILMKKVTTANQNSKWGLGRHSSGTNVMTWSKVCVKTLALEPPWANQSPS